MNFMIAGNVKGEGRETAVLLKKIADEIETLDTSDTITVEGDGVQITAVFEQRNCVEIVEMEPQPKSDGMLVYWNGFVWVVRPPDALRQGPSWPILRNMVCAYCQPDVDGEITHMEIRRIHSKWYWLVKWVENA